MVIYGVYFSHVGKKVSHRMQIFSKFNSLYINKYKFSKAKLLADPYLTSRFREVQTGFSISLVPQDT